MKIQILKLIAWLRLKEFPNFWQTIVEHVRF